MNTDTDDVGSSLAPCFILDLYEYLLYNCEELGEEFSTILHDNLWDLYEE